MQSVQYRRAIAEDAAECVVLRGQTRQNAISAERLASLGITAETWGNETRTASLIGHVCLEDQRVVGYGFGQADTGEVVVLALLPEYESRGIGKELLSRVVQDLRAIGHQRLYLGCSRDPASRSYGFYRRLGWQTTGKYDANGDEVLELNEQPSLPATSEA
jgi:GNAT superfamily N-acetyltransferase